jgi:hypothetical protein
MSKIILHIVAVFLISIMTSSVAYAACSSPIGQAGDMIYNQAARVLQWCDGTSWYAAGQINPAGPEDGCLGPVGVGGDIIYNQTEHLLQYCDGDHWQGVSGGVDKAPDGFTFTDLTNQTQSTVVTSNVVTINGIDVATDVTITGQGTPQFRINGGAWVTSGNITNGQTLQLRLTTSAALAMTHTATVVVGTVGGTWSASTVGSDTVPNAFSFTDRTNVAKNTLITSNSITISGINSSTPVSVSGAGAQISINGGAWGTGGNISNGQTLQVRLTSSSSNNTTLTATVTVGGVNDSWTVATSNIGGSATETAVFATSTTYTGNFGGMAGVHDACATRAAAAGLVGTYKAWSSDTTSDDPESTFARSAMPYKLPNGTKVADNWADLVDGTLDAPINATETGAALTGTNVVWTHVNASGEHNGNDCGNWTNAGSGSNADVGLASSATSTWSSNGSAACNGLYRLYCFEQANSPPTTIALTDTMSYDDLSNNTTTTIGTNKSFGAAAADRYMILALYFNDENSTTITTVTIGGVTATSLYQSTNATIRMAFFGAQVPTGTTGNVTVRVANDGTLAYTYGALWRATGLQSTTPSATANSSADPGTGTLAVPNQGFALGFTGSGGAGGSPSCTWTGMTESFDQSNANIGVSGAMSTAGGTTISINSDWSASTSGGRKSIYAAWR